MALKLYLQLFAEGESAAPGENAGTPTAQGETAAAPTAEEDRQALYAKFKEEFKTEFSSEMQATIKDRLKKSKAEAQSYKEQLDSMAPMLELLHDKYGTDDNSKLLAAMEADDKLYEQEAYDRGMTVDQVKEWHRIERENRMLRAKEEARAREAQFESWDRQFAELTQVYPQCDPRAEVQNPNFVRLMNAGVPIRDAFELIHKDELTRGAMQFTAGKVAEKMANAAIANQSHPTENGMNSSAASVTNPNIEALTIDQIKDAFRRSKAGEPIDYVNHW